MNSLACLNDMPVFWDSRVAPMPYLQIRPDQIRSIQNRSDQQYRMQYLGSRVAPMPYLHTRSAVQDAVPYRFGPTTVLNQACAA
jgi:hypothetical protein